MTTTLTGKNSFLLTAKRREISSSHLAQYGDLSIEQIDCEEAEPQVIYDAVTNLPFLVEKKLVIILSPGVNKALTEKLPDWLEHGNPQIDVLLIEPNVDKRTAWYKWLQKNTQLIACEEPSERELPAWLKEYAAVMGVDIRPDAARLLVERAGANQEQLAREIEKLSAASKLIDVALVKELVDPLPQDTVFDMLDALSHGQLKKALDLYRSLVLQKVDPSEILGLIAWQLTVWTKLVVAKRAGERDLSSATRLHPFVVQKNGAAIANLRLKDIEQLLDVALEAERHIKVRGLPAGSVVENLLIQLSVILSV